VAGYLMVPINSNGVVVDLNIAENAKTAMDASLDLNDIFLYSHGWSTDADGAMTLYNRFSIEFMRWLARNPRAGTHPHGALSVGIHWPSELTEEGGIVPKAFADILGAVQPLTFYTMEKRADTTGTHGVYAVLRQLIQNYVPRAATGGEAPPALRIHLIGHSFGCKVVTAAVEAVYEDIASGTMLPPAGLSFNVVLIQAAFENKQLDVAKCYGDLEKLNLRMLVTTSQKDTALTKAFPMAHRLVDFFNLDPAPALGAAGPTPATKNAFGGADDINVGPNFSVTASANCTKRLVVADLTDLHAAHTESDSQWGGHHSGFSHDEVYALVAGFLRL